MNAQVPITVDDRTLSGPLFAAWRAGDEQACEDLFKRFYPDLTRIAGGLLRNERHVSLSAGDLVQETVLRLIQLRQIAYSDRAHFLALSARFMRRVLVDHVRAKQSDKRYHQKVTLTTRIKQERVFDLGALDAAMARLSVIDRERADIVEMRYFGGMSLKDIADVLNLSEATIKRRWVTARAWLVDAMENPFVVAQFDA